MSNRDREKSREYKRNQEWGVLIADDEPTHLLIMKRLIARQGYRVDVAATIEEAIEKLCTGNFRLLITDWGTPAIDGVSLCRHVRRNMQDMYVYTIILSARDMIEHIVTGLRSGADDYLTKPVFEPELLARLQTGKRVISLEKRLKAANDELRELTLIDPLTLLRNRRFLDDELPRLVDVAAQKLAPLSVVMCDIDHFKRVNDTYGESGQPI